MLDAEQIEMWDYWNEPMESDHVGKTPLQMVTEYHRAASLPLNEEWKFDSDLESMRSNLVYEEFDEFANELGKDKILKELADLVYVTYGYAATFGWDLDEAVRRVHENNMGRMFQEDGTIKYREDGKVIKNPDYPQVNLGDLV